MARRIGLRGVGALLAALAVCNPGPARADVPTEAEIAAARQLFNEGKELERQNNWAEALTRFKKVAEVKTTPQVRFHIALCEENLGHLVSAINGYEIAAEEAKQAGAVATDVADNAPARAEALRKRVPHVRIVVKGRLATSRILLDGAPVAPALLGTNIPVDPGSHTVDVETDGKNVSRKELTLAERAVETVELAVNDPETAPIAPSTGPGPGPAPAPPPADSSGLSFPPPVPAIVAGGVGLASLVAAGVFLGLRESTIGEVRDTCSDPDRDRGCDRSKQDVAERGETYTIVADVLLGLGAAGLIAGGVLWLTLPGPGSSSNQTSVRVTPTARGVHVLGRF